jgi:hypothetical protein
VAGIAFSFYFLPPKMSALLLLIFWGYNSSAVVFWDESCIVCAQRDQQEI